MGEKEKKEYSKRILLTGGAGFIGSHLVRRLVNRYPGYQIVCFDALTYAGNLENLRDIEEAPNYTFVKGDICNFDEVKRAFADYGITDVIHLAAESHVDRSIKDPFSFAKTNVLGTLTLLQAAKEFWEASPEGYSGKLFYHVSTDEVYGSLALDPTAEKAPYGADTFAETTPYSPHSPYSASKASSDHFVRAYHDTYGMPTVITNCSNNYGPYQFPEKLIPLIINNILNRSPLPIYGKGENVRDWLYVEDHASAIDKVFHEGKPGETYNIGGENEWKNIDLVRELIRITDRLLGRKDGESESLLTYVTDRKGHDLRYAIDSAKIRRELGWAPATSTEEGLEKTVKWYLANKEWLERVTSGEYREYYQQYYGKDED
ncbi:MAG: dTDP-glucose 4,6-dehydratase [Muribaculaceae bacterium]|nr:dTDP-glucose 4,6-dehydratase [Muribaculaceae bacterium]